MSIEQRLGATVKAKAELERVKALAKAAIDLIEAGKRVHLPINGGVGAQATVEDVLAAIADGGFERFFLRADLIWEPDVTETYKRNWLDENPQFEEDDEGNTYLYYGPGGEKLHRVPTDWLQGKEELTEALIAGRYLAETSNVIPIRAEPVIIDSEPGMLGLALAYTQQGWFVFPVWGVRLDGRCECGNPKCKNTGKHPIGGLVPTVSRTPRPTKRRSGGGGVGTRQQI